MSERPSGPAEVAATDQAGVAPAVSWQGALADGRFQLAYQAFVVSDENDPQLREALVTLADIEGYVRDKGWQRALTKLAQLEEQPALIDWQGLELDLRSLRESSAALDQRDSAKVLDLLRSRSTVFFTAEVETQRGTALIFDNELEAARGHFERALEVDPRHYRAITNLGNIALEQGRIEEAVEAYERALKLNDDFSNAYHNLGVAYRKQGQFGKSVRMLRRAQRASNRREVEQARSQLAGRGRGLGRNARWILIAAAAVVAYLLLRSRGII